MSNETLIFVYNAESGLLNTLGDISHKILSPATYNCPLCALTHSYFSMRKEWSGFLEHLTLQTEFLHRDEFLEKYHQIDSEPPFVLHYSGDQLSLIMDRTSIESCDNLVEFIDKLKIAIDKG